MPQRAVSRSRYCGIVFAIVAALAPGVPLHAAVNAAIDPDAARESAPFVYAKPGGVVSLTGFHCSITEDAEAWAFADDPEYTETPPTIGLEFLADASGLAPMSASMRHDEPLSGDMRSPLSATLRRMMIEGDITSLIDDGAVEEVSLPEASMSVAGLAGRCRP
jgi:hypothetical protein